MSSGIRPKQAIALAAIALCGAVARAQVPPVSWSASMPRMAADALRTAVERSPDDVDLQARLGIAFAKLGDYPSALPCFTFAGGSGTYEGLGIGLHAETLSELGRHAEAALLRREQLSAPQPKSAELVTRVGLVDDLRRLEPLAAEQAAWEAVAAFPWSPTAWAVFADVRMDLGDLDGATTALALPTPEEVTPRVWQSRARLARLEDDLYGAEALLRTGLGQHPMADLLAEDLAETLLTSGDASAAMDLLSSPRFKRTHRPRRLALEVRALLALGEAGEACQRWRRLDGLYPAVAAELSACPGR